MSTVVTKNSPQQMLDYINGIALPAVWDVIDKGSRYTVVDDKGSSWAVTTVDDEDMLVEVLNTVTALKAVVPKKEGGKLTFYSHDALDSGANAFGMTITGDSQQLEDAINALETGGQAVDKIIEHDSKKIILSTPWAAESLELFERMPDSLTASQQVAINTFIINEKTAGNWATYDEFWLFGLSTANALTGWIANTKPTNNGGSHSVKGFFFDGVNNWIDTTIAPKTAGGKYALNDANVTGFISTFTKETVGQQYVWANNNTTGSVPMTIFGYSAGGFLSRMNSATNLQVSLPTLLGCYSQIRTASNANEIFEDGVSLVSSGAISSEIPEPTIGIGCRNAIDGPNSFAEMTIASFLIGAGIGFDPAAHNINIRNLLTAIGTIP